MTRPPEDAPPPSDSLQEEADIDWDAFTAEPPTDDLDWPAEPEVPPLDLEQLDLDAPTDPLDWPEGEPAGDWPDLTDEAADPAPLAQMTTAPPERLGYVERINLPELGLPPLTCLCAPSIAGSELRLPAIDRLSTIDRMVLPPLGGVLETTATLGDRRWTVRFTLGPPADPPVVLGRDALAGRFVVDAAARFLLGDPSGTSDA